MNTTNIYCKLWIFSYRHSFHFIQDVLYFADICAGPGGFSEYTLWRRCNAPYHIHSSSESKRLNNTLSPNHHSNINDKLLDDTTESVDHNSSTNNTSTASEKQQPLLSAKGFGLTLTGHCDFRENDFLAGPKEAFMAHYGPGRDGDVTKWSNLASFASLIGRSTNNAGVHILMADGVSSVINFFVMTIVYFKSCSKSFLICLSVYYLTF